MDSSVTLDVSEPAKLTINHVVDKFNCGYPVLNEWLRRHALQNQRANAAMTFVVCSKNRVVGYYSLAVGSVEHEVVPTRIKKGLARHCIPVMVLARLAVDIQYQGRNIGRGLLKDAIWRTLRASEFAGIRAIFVHAKDEEARRFYEKFDFEVSPVDPLKLMLLIKDARKTLELP
ncbi:MAG: GNAT family N-acetyltransferase [Deltaproteobacteria bacterium]|nr:GNAT family N-acetyltransferase [Deltaproteobacteria bacterium]MBW1793486.1 GNAT family N-acetyltransferase [Deltaproteobacteria bacterium]